jgi:hypothetical protein
VHWLNVIKLTEANIINFYTPEQLQKRARQWFTLGVSVAQLLKLPSAVHVARAFLQLLEEYEYSVAHEQSKARAEPLHIRSARPPPSQDNGASKPSRRGAGSYDYLIMPPACIVGNMDYCQVVLALCDVLSLVYSKFLDPACSAPELHDSIMKSDKKVKSLVLSKISTDLTATAQPLINRQLQGLLNHMFLDDSTTTSVLVPLSKGDGLDEGAPAPEDD